MAEPTAIRAAGVVGCCQIGPRLDAGPLNEVYEASCPGHSGPLVIELRPGGSTLDPMTVQACRSEVALVGHLRHPHIASLLELGTTPDGVPYLVREHVEGETLEAILARRRLTAPELVNVVKQAAAALATAHGVGVIHGDLRPNKLLLTEAGSSVKLLGFGLWRLRTHRRREARPAADGYTARELATGAAEVEVDGRADQFSLAAIAYRAFVGLEAFGYDDLDHPHVPLDEFAGCPPAVEQVFRLGLSRQPAHRFRTIRQFAAALERAVDGVPPAIDEAVALAKHEQPTWPAIEPLFAADGEDNERRC
jgi:serine/threonine protein kinase